jgi:hypothetical protein
MKLNRYTTNESAGPAVQRYGPFSKEAGKLALLLSALSAAIAFGTGYASTAGFKAQWLAPAVPSGQSVGSVNDGWYHPSESPGLGQG